MSNQGCQCRQAHGACATEFQYAVKIVCGEMKPANNNPVAPGRYWTAVNVHNPDKCKEANFWLKIGIAELSLESPVSQYYGPIPLRPDGMIEFDCPLIRWLAGQLVSPPPTFVKGYMVIKSDVELDVVAVYTGSTGTSNSFHTERAPARCVPVCEDLLLPLNTGVANWQTVFPAATGPVAILSGINSLWLQPQFGFVWVSQLSSDSNTASVGWRRYELCFELCDGFVRPSSAIPLHIVVDNTAEVFLNGSGGVGSTGNVGTISGSANYATPHVLNVSPSLFRAGRNCFHVDVNNVAGAKVNPTGFALTGFLHIGQGKCPCAPLPIVAGRAADHAWERMAAFFDSTRQN